MDECTHSGAQEELEFETQTDIITLLENVRCEGINEFGLKQALQALSTICSSSVEAQDYFRVAGGVKDTAKLIENNFCPQTALPAALFCLACAVKKNVSSQNIVLNGGFLTAVQQLLTDDDERITDSSAFFLACAVADNGKGQQLSKETGCLTELLNILRRYLQENNIEDSRWSIVTRAIAVCINNPQNERNQGICSSLLPLALKFIGSEPQNLCLRHILAFICSVVSNNVSNQNRLRNCGGLGALANFIKQQQRNCRNLRVPLFIGAVSALDACIADNVSSGIQAGDMDMIPSILKLVEDYALEPPDLKTILLAVAHILESHEKFCSLITEGTAYGQLVKLLTTSQDEELFKTIKYIFTLCKPKDNTESVETENETLQDTTRNFMDSVNEKLEALSAQIHRREIFAAKQMSEEDAEAEHQQSTVKTSILLSSRNAQNQASAPLPCWEVLQNDALCHEGGKSTGYERQALRSGRDGYFVGNLKNAVFNSKNYVDTNSCQPYNDHPCHPSHHASQPNLSGQQVPFTNHCTQTNWSEDGEEVQSPHSSYTKQKRCTVSTQNNQGIRQLCISRPVGKELSDQAMGDKAHADTATFYHPPGLCQTDPDTLKGHAQAQRSFKSGHFCSSTDEGREISKSDRCHNLNFNSQNYCNRTVHRNVARNKSNEIQHSNSSYRQQRSGYQNRPGLNKETQTLANSEVVNYGDVDYVSVSSKSDAETDSSICHGLREQGHFKDTGYNQEWYAPAYVRGMQESEITGRATRHDTHNYRNINGSRDFHALQNGNFKRCSTHEKESFTNNNCSRHGNENFITDSCTDPVPERSISKTVTNNVFENLHCSSHANHPNDNSNAKNDINLNNNNCISHSNENPYHDGLTAHDNRTIDSNTYRNLTSGSINSCTNHPNTNVNSDSGIGALNVISEVNDKGALEKGIVHKTQLDLLDHFQTVVGSLMSLFPKSASGQSLPDKKEAGPERVGNLSSGDQSEVTAGEYPRDSPCPSVTASSPGEKVTCPARPTVTMNSMSHVRSNHDRLSARDFLKDIDHQNEESLAQNITKTSKHADMSLKTSRRMRNNEGKNNCDTERKEHVESTPHREGQMHFEPKDLNCKETKVSEKPTVSDTDNSAKSRSVMQATLNGDTTFIKPSGPVLKVQNAQNAKTRTKNIRHAGTPQSFASASLVKSLTPLPRNEMLTPKKVAQRTLSKSPVSPALSAFDLELDRIAKNRCISPCKSAASCSMPATPRKSHTIPIKDVTRSKESRKRSIFKLDENGGGNISCQPSLSGSDSVTSESPKTEQADTFELSQKFQGRKTVPLVPDTEEHAVICRPTSDMSSQGQLQLDLENRIPDQNPDYLDSAEHNVVEKCPGCAVGQNLNSRTFNIAVETCGFTCSYHRSLRQLEREEIKKQLKNLKVSEASNHPDLKDCSMSPISNKGDVYSFPSDDDKGLSSPCMDVSMRSVQAALEKKACKKGRQGDGRRPRVPYSEQEIANLVDGVEVMGRRWQQILCSYHFHPSRTSIDLKDKYKRITTTQIEEKERRPALPFSMCEVRRLKRGVKMFGYNWKAILTGNKFLPGRTASDLRHKWKALNKAAR